MMHTINPKTTTKIAKQRIINHMPLKDRKMGVKIQIIRKQEKNKVKIKDMGKNRTDCKMMYLNLTISRTTLPVNNKEAEIVKMDKKAIPSIAAYTNLTLNTKTQRS